jgi:hypothetical protein
MSVGDWIAVVAVSLTALGGITGIVQFLVKHYLAELRPNSGSSMKDQITRLEQRVDDIYKIILNKTLS